MSDLGNQAVLPTITSTSLDVNGRKLLWGDRVLTSCLIYRDEVDPFFNPGATYSGYAADGQYYPIDGNYASWYNESPSAYRGATPWFPDKSLVLVTDVGLSILEIKENSLELWMTFLRGDYLGFVANPDPTLGVPASHTPESVSYTRGVISIVSKPDPGSGLYSIIINRFNFTTGDITMEYTPDYNNTQPPQ